MALIERLSANDATNLRKRQTAPTLEVVKRGTAAEEYQELKSRVHNRLFDHLDLTKLSTVDDDRISEDIATLTLRILDEEKSPFTLGEKQQIVSEVQHEVFGLGPLEPLLADESICDILVNGHDCIFVERRGKIEPTIARFKDEAHLMRIIEKILSSVGRRVDESTPMVDARLEDGSRVNVIVPPLSIDGPSMSIRRFAVDPLTAEDLIESHALTDETMALLEATVAGRLNVLISGGTGAGKTTLLNVLSGFIPAGERIVTIEDSAELQLRQPHVVRLETRPPNIEGKGQVTQRELLINTLRMRPDRIIVGEVRGGEALDMLQAMNTGHEGSITTIHANSPRDALTRIETMVAMSGLDIPPQAVRHQISSAIDVVIQLARLADGTRCVTSVQEITGSEGDVVTMQEIFHMKRDGVSDEGVIQRQLLPNGVRPRFCEKLRAAGIELRAGLFDPKAYAGDKKRTEA